MTSRARPKPAMQQTAVQRLAFVAAPSQPASKAYGSLFEVIAGLGHKVLSLSPSPDHDGGASAATDNIEFGSFDPAPVGWSFLQQRRAVEALSGTLKNWRAHGVISTGPVMALLAGMAAEQAGINRRIAVMSHTFDANEIEAWRKALAVSTAVIFFSRDDSQAALAAGMLQTQMPSFTVPGAGVDLQTSRVLPLPNSDNGLVFLMHVPGDHPDHAKIAIEAAKALVKTHSNARVILAAKLRGKDQNLPQGISLIDDELAGLAQCHVYVHVPGLDAMPAGLLDALAAGRPIITSNSPGCRETADDFVNGCLVTPGSAPALLQAMEIFVKQPDLLHSAANASRLKAERWFDRRDVNQRWLKALTLTT